MTQLKASARSHDLWERAVVFALTLVLTSSDITLSMGPYIHWASFLMAVILLLPFAFREFLLPVDVVEQIAQEQSTRTAPARLPILLFLGAAYVPVLYGAPLASTLVAIGKLAAILLIGFPIIAARVRLALSAFYGLVFGVWINFALMLTGILLGGPAASLKSPGRWGTVLNYPGALWRLGITCWMFALYLCIRRFSIWSFSLLLVSTSLVYLDGARTALLLLAVGGGYVIASLGLRGRRPVKIILIGLSVVVLFVTISEGMFSQQDGAIARMVKTVSSVAASGGDGFGAADIARFTMLQDVITAIHNHPVLGTGIGSTTTNTMAGPMVIHISYLQIWADCGVAGFIGYVWLVWGWLPFLPEAINRIRHLADARERAIYYNALFLLVVFGLTGLFHPLSTEWAQWIPFIVPYGLIWHITHTHFRTTQSHA